MSQHTESSSYREKLIEHLFAGELLKLSWLKNGCELEISKPEVDNAGYDLVGEVPGIIRHIQVKTSVIGGSTASQKVHLRLCGKPSGCVVWIYFDETTLTLGPFLYFGAAAGQRLPAVDGLKVAKHTKGNKDGLKAERPNIRVVPKRLFESIPTIDGIYAKLFQQPEKQSEY